ncbi:MAG: hypothetical protein GY812_17705, partial [Actinomycetia bacterium]|nr:hypothetical protein [Actinomycetes bacterium]
MYITVVAAALKNSTQMVDVECNEATMGALAPEYDWDDCRTAGWDKHARFGYFKSERQGVGRHIGSENDLLREYYAATHKVWKKAYELQRDDKGELILDQFGKAQPVLDADGNPVTIPLAERDVEPIVYYMNLNFPESMQPTATRIGQDWNQAFAEALAAAKGISVDALLDEVEAETGKRLVFEVRENTCSVNGINDYIAANPSMQDVVDEGTRGEGLLPGNLERTCAGLTNISRQREDAKSFTWQQAGDTRFHFIYWVNEDAPNGPLGYGPSATDVETGRIVSGNAYVYGAAVDSYARSAADVVGA